MIMVMMHHGEEIEIEKTLHRQDIHGPMTDIFMKAIGHAKTY